MNRTESRDSHARVLLWRILFVCPFANKEKLMNEKHYWTLLSKQSGPFDAHTVLNYEVLFFKDFCSLSKITRPEHLTVKFRLNVEICTTPHGNLFPISLWFFFPIHSNQVERKKKQKKTKNKVLLFITYQRCLSGAHRKLCSFEKLLGA